MRVQARTAQRPPSVHAFFAYIWCAPAADPAGPPAPRCPHPTAFRAVSPTPTHPPTPLLRSSASRPRCGMRFHSDPLYQRWTPNTAVVSLGATRTFIFRTANDYSTRQAPSLALLPAPPPFLPSARTRKGHHDARRRRRCARTRAAPLSWDPAHTHAPGPPGCGASEKVPIGFGVTCINFEW